MDAALRDTSSVKVSCVHEAIKTQKTKVMGIEMEFEVFKEGKSNSSWPLNGYGVGEKKYCRVHDDLSPRRGKLRKKKDKVRV